MFSSSASPSVSDRLRGASPFSQEGSAFREARELRPKVKVGPAGGRQTSAPDNTLGKSAYTSYFSAQQEASWLRGLHNLNKTCQDEANANMTTERDSLGQAGGFKEKGMHNTIFSTNIPEVASAVKQPNPKEEPKPLRTYSTLEKQMFTLTCFSSLVFLFCLSYSRWLPRILLRLLSFLLSFLLLACLFIFTNLKETPLFRSLFKSSAPASVVDTNVTPESLFVNLHPEGLENRRAPSSGLTSDPFGRNINFRTPDGSSTCNTDITYRNIFEPNENEQSCSQDSGLLGLLGSVKMYLTAPFESVEAPKAASGEFAGIPCFSEEQTLKMLGKFSSFESVAFQTRLWISKKVIHPISNSTKLVNHALKEKKIGMLSIEDPDYYYEYNPKTGTQTNSNPKNLIELYQSDPKNPVVIARLQLERYVNVPLYSARKYIVQRISEFAQHSFLSDFCWNSGSDSSWKYSAGTFALPTDAELLAHIFVTFMDLATPSALGVDSTRFSANHFLERGLSTGGLNGLFIKQVSSRPPHYVVIGGGKVFELPKGENNLFSAIYVFAFLVMRDHCGYISGIPFHAPEIGLDELVR